QRSANARRSNARRHQLFLHDPARTTGISGCASRAPDDLRTTRIPVCGRPHKLRVRSCRCLSPGRHLYGPHSERGKTGGSAGTATDQIRAGHQPEDGQGTGSCNPRQIARSRRRGDRMKRREFITLLGGAAGGWARAGGAQQSAMPVIGFLSGVSPDGYALYAAAFRQGLKEAGYVDGQNATIEYRWAEDHYDRLPALAADLIQRKVTVIAATTTPAALAAKAATSTIPLGSTTGGDPTKLGLVASLNRPGGNVTGVSNLLLELGSKQLGLLRELVPAITAITILVNPNFPGTESQLRDVEAAARTLGLQLIVLRAGTDHEIDTAFATIAQQGGRALVVGVD